MTKLKAMCASAALLVFVAGSAFAAAPPNTVKLLGTFFTTLTNPGATASVQKTFGPFATDALVFTAANGRTQPVAGGGPAGAVTRIKRDGVPIASDDSFEDVPPNFPSEMNAARQFILKKGNITTVSAEVDPTGANGINNTNTFVDLRIDAIQICKPAAC
jgi:hypothetical protein